MGRQPKPKMPVKAKKKGKGKDTKVGAEKRSGGFPGAFPGGSDKAIRSRMTKKKAPKQFFE